MMIAKSTALELATDDSLPPAQTQKYADLYASDFLQLLNYPFFYYFSAPNRLLSHEQETLAFLERIERSSGSASGSPSSSN